MLLQRALLAEFANSPQCLVLCLHQDRASLAVVLFQLTVASRQFRVPFAILLVPVEGFLVRLKQFVFADEVQLTVAGGCTRNGFRLASRYVDVGLQVVDRR